MKAFEILKKAHAEYNEMVKTITFYWNEFKNGHIVEQYDKIEAFSDEIGCHYDIDYDFIDETQTTAFIMINYNVCLECYIDKENNITFNKIIDFNDHEDFTIYQVNLETNKVDQKQII